MRTMSSVAVVGMLSVGAQAANEDCDLYPNAGCTATYEGRFLMHAVDERRFFIAVDRASIDRELDDALDVLILFTAPERLPAVLNDASKSSVVAGQIRLDNAALEIRISHGEVLSIPLKDLAWSRYSGYDGHPNLPSIGELTAARLNAMCDHEPGSCWELNGFDLWFPY